MKGITMFGYELIKTQKRIELESEALFYKVECQVLKKQEIEYLDTISDLDIENACMYNAARVLPEWAKSRFWNHFNFFFKALPLLEKDSTSEGFEKTSQESNIPLSTLQRYWYAHRKGEKV
jgi:hypothetical protein